MRPVNKREHKIIRKLIKRDRISYTDKPKYLKVFYQEQGNFTIATITLDGEFASGVAKRNPHDHKSGEIGETIAFSRALEAMFAPLPVEEGNAMPSILKRAFSALDAMQASQ